MEIANAGNGRLAAKNRQISADGVRVWQATEADFSQILQLLKITSLHYKHVDWFDACDWLGSPGFVVSCDEDGAKGCLAITAEPKPAAWVRLAAVERRGMGYTRSFLQLAAMFDPVCDYLHKNGVSVVGWMAPTVWPDGWPEKLGFTEYERVITYQKPTFNIPNLRAVPNLMIRPAVLDDMPHLAKIEARAFAPIWRHSAKGLGVAMSQAFSFDVALLDGKLVGFQHSATNRGSAVHLARITVDPMVQNRGIGGQLLAHAIRGYQRRGAIHMTLNTESANVGAQRLYARFGYVANRRRFSLYTMELSTTQ